MAVAGFALACLILCVLRYAWLAHRISSLSAQRTQLTRQQVDQTRTLKDLESPKREYDQLQQSNKAARSELLSLISKREHSPSHPAPDFDLERQRIDRLLAALADHANADLLIDRIFVGDNGELLIEGKCLPNASVDSFAEELAAVLPAAGWNVSPAQKKPSGSVPSGTFTLRFAPLPLLRKNTPGGAEIVPSPVVGVMK